MGTPRTVTAVIAISLLTACASADTSTDVTTTDGTTIDGTAVVDTAPPTPPSLTTEAPATTAAPSADVLRWAEDLQVLSDGVRDLHPNPFWRQPEVEFDAALAAAPERLATMSDADARAEVMRLTARIDGHTGVYLGEVGFHLYDVHLYDFGGEFAIIAAGDPTLIGATVLRIGGMPVAAAAEAVTPYSPFDNAVHRAARRPDAADHARGSACGRRDRRRRRTAVRRAAGGRHGTDGRPRTVDVGRVHGKGSAPDRDDEERGGRRVGPRRRAVLDDHAPDRSERRPDPLPAVQPSRQHQRRDHDRSTGGRDRCDAPQRRKHPTRRRPSLQRGRQRPHLHTPARHPRERTRRWLRPARWWC